MSELIAQTQALTSGFGMASFSPRTHVEFRGDDRVTFLHNLCTADIKQLGEGQGTEAFFTNVQGKVIGHAALFCGAESIRLETSPDQADDLISHLDRYLITEDVQILDRTAEWDQLLLAGQQANGWLSQTLKLPQALTDDFSNQCGDFDHEWFDVRRVPIIAGDCFLLVTASDAIGTLSVAFLTEGAVECVPIVVEALRIEHGWPFYAQDISVNNLPQEVGRDEQAISFVKGCYLGQETVARIDALGHVNKHLVGLRFESDQPPAVGTTILVADKDAGTVTSVAWSPRLGAIGLGYVRREHATAGTEIKVGQGIAKVTDLPMAQGG